MRSNNTMAVGMVFVLLSVTYNMALASDGSQESGSIWAWLNDSKNSGAVQAVGSMAQATAAIITFFLMWRLGVMQNSMSKRQMAMSTLDKRYEFYRNLIDTIKRGITNSPRYYSLNIDGYNVVASEYIDSISNILYAELAPLKGKLSFFFHDKSLIKLKSLMEELLIHLEKIKDLNIEILDEMAVSNHPKLMSMHNEINKEKRTAFDICDEIDKAIQSEFSFGNFI